MERQCFFFVSEQQSDIKPQFILNIFTKIKAGCVGIFNERIVYPKVSIFNISMLRKIKYLFVVVNNSLA